MMNKSSKMDDIDILLYAAMPYVKKKEVDIYNSVDLSETLSPAATKKINRRLKHEKKDITRRESYHPIYDSLKRVAIVVLLIMSVGFTFVISVEAVREAIWDTVVEWYENSIFFSYVNDGNVAVSSEIIEYKEPDLDDSYTRFERRKSKYNYVIEYEKNDTLIVYEQSLLSDYEILLSNNDTLMKAIKINGYEGITTSFETQGECSTTIIWNDNVYTYKLVGNIPLDKLTSIAEKVK